MKADVLVQKHEDALTEGELKKSGGSPLPMHDCVEADAMGAIFYLGKVRDLVHKLKDVLTKVEASKDPTNPPAQAPMKVG